MVFLRPHYWLYWDVGRGAGAVVDVENVVGREPGGVVEGEDCEGAES